MYHDYFSNFARRNCAFFSDAVPASYPGAFILLQKYIYNTTVIHRDQIYNTTVIHRDQYSERAGVLGEDARKEASLSRRVLPKHSCALAILISMYECSIVYIVH